MTANTAIYAQRRARLVQWPFVGRFGGFVKWVARFRRRDVRLERVFAFDTE